MKPDTRTAMRQLITQVRASIPFDLPEAQMCLDGCQGCSKKLLDYLEGELAGWEQRLDAGERPNFGELHALAKSSRKIHTLLRKNGIINDQ